MKQLKKIATIMILFSLIIGICGCGIKSPSNTVKDYFEQIKKGENGDVTQLLDKTLESTQDKDKESKLSDESTKKMIATLEKLTYTINSESVNGDSATVNVKVNGPDMSKVMAEFIQKAFSTALAQSFSGKQANDEDNNKLFESMLMECLDKVTYSDRTGDISLTKIDGQWKITDDDSLTTLLLGINGSAFSGEKTKDTESKKEIKVMTLNEAFNVTTENGDYILTIEGARSTDKRNQFSEKKVSKVVILDYSYANESFGEKVSKDLFIDSSAFQVLDDEGNVLDTYPVNDENRVPKGTPVGGKCKGSATYAVTTDSKNLNVTFTRGSEKVAQIIVPIQ